MSAAEAVRSTLSVRSAAVATAAGLVAILAFTMASARSADHGQRAAAQPVMSAPPATGRDADLLEQVLRGRQLVITRDCGACHGGADPASENWLTGGDPYAFDNLTAYAANLTPDAGTGIGRYTDEQIFNALRYGLRPSATPDVVITSAVPGAGSHPADPDYLSPAMPWAAWRHLGDQQLRDIIAYLRHGLKPVHNAVPVSEKPVDRWANWSTPAATGPHPLPPFPTEQEELRRPDRRDDVIRGRALVASLGCGDCHGGRAGPAASGWLAGSRSADNNGGGARPGPFEESFIMGPFTVAARNLTPDNITGLGRFSERQLFNALRYGLRPGETEDVEITSMVPGEGNHPPHPKYLAPSMPWLAWRHLGDDELRAVVSYLLYGLKPVRNRLPDSEGPPDFWVSAYQPLPPYPAPPFPTAREQRGW